MSEGELIAEARARLATTVFDGTLRQLQAELFMKEQAAGVADRALAAAGNALEAGGAALAELERQVADLGRKLELADLQVLNREQQIGNLEARLQAALDRVDLLGRKLDEEEARRGVGSLVRVRTTEPFREYAPRDADGGGR